jgi:hypothetical protein
MKYFTINSFGGFSVYLLFSNFVTERKSEIRGFEMGTLQRFILEMNFIYFHS